MRQLRPISGGAEKPIMITETHVKLLRMVVASPSDVQPERDAVSNVVEELSFTRCIRRTKSRPVPHLWVLFSRPCHAMHSQRQLKL
jgi:hypothetical protein